MPFFHEKELKTYCRELRRDLRRATRDLEKYDEVDPKKYREALRWNDRIEREIERLERIVDFPDER